MSDRRVRTMVKTAVRDERIAVVEGRIPTERQRASSRVQRIAYGLSGMIAALMVVASGAGLWIDGLYRDGSWAREAFRGGDLTTLVLVVPVLVGSLVLSIRGSMTARAIWIGALAYGVYSYAYYVFGAAFNDVFLLHIALLTLSIWATALAASSLDIKAVAAAFRVERAARWIGGFLVVVGTVLVFRIDLPLRAPAWGVGGALLWRRTAVGVVFGAAMTVMGMLYQVNLF